MAQSWNCRSYATLRDSHTPNFSQSRPNYTTTWYLWRFSFWFRISWCFPRSRIGDHDTAPLFSIDGAQIFEKKASDCWIYIWAILDLAPNSRYKVNVVEPGGFIGGPSPPKNYDSFLFPTPHHLSALQKEGFRAWCSSRFPSIFSLVQLMAPVPLTWADSPVTRATTPAGSKVWNIKKYQRSSIVSMSQVL